MCALDTAPLDANVIVANPIEMGLLLKASRSNTLRFMPGLNVSEDEINAMLRVLDNVLSK